LGSGAFFGYQVYLDRGKSLTQAQGALAVQTGRYETRLDRADQERQAIQAEKDQLSREVVELVKKQQESEKSRKKKAQNGGWWAKVKKSVSEQQQKQQGPK